MFMTYVLAFLAGRVSASWAAGRDKQAFLRLCFSRILPFGLDPDRMFLASILLAILPLFIFSPPAELTILSLFASGSLLAVRSRLLSWTSPHGPAHLARSRDPDLAEFGETWIEAARHVPERRLLAVSADRLPLLFEASRMASLGGLDRRTAAFVRRSTARIRAELDRAVAPRRSEERRRLHVLLDREGREKALLDAEEREEGLLEMAERMRSHPEEPIPAIGQSLLRLRQAVGTDEADAFLAPRRAMLETLMEDAERFGMADAARRDLLAFLSALDSAVETAEGNLKNEAERRQAEAASGLLRLNREER